MTPAGPMILGAASSIMQGMAGAAAANAEARRAEINAFIGKTRAIQTGNAARTNLESEVASMRSVFAANGQPMDSAAFDLVSRVREIRGGERRIAVDNEMAGVRDFQMQAANARQRAFGSMLSGFGKALPSLFDLAQYSAGPRY